MGSKVLVTSPRGQTPRRCVFTLSLVKCGARDRPSGLCKCSNTQGIRSRGPPAGSEFDMCVTYVIIKLELTSGATFDMRAFRLTARRPGVPMARSSMLLQGAITVWR